MRRLQSDSEGHRTRSGMALAPLLAALLLAAGAAWAAPPVELASGLGAAIGVDLDEVNNRLYFVEWTAGNLKRIDLTPGCDIVSPATCPPPVVVLGGLNHPEDVVVVPDLDVAYVTTRDDPGTTGKLWRIDLSTSPATPSLVTFNLGAPHQVALDPLNNAAFVVGYDLGRLWRVDLTSGAKLTVTTGLDHPVGLAITSDRTRAYVTEQGAANRLVEIDLTTGGIIRDVATGLTAAFYLAWTDPAEIALYLVERDPANRLLRVDLLTGIAVEAAAGLPVRPSGVAASYLQGAAYVTTNDRLVRVDLGGLPLTEPVFLGVGHVPSTSIVAGYATTDPGYFYQVKHSPFGGTLNIFGNLNNFRALGATHYRVLVSDGGPFTQLNRSWNAYWWDPGQGKYILRGVGPDPSDNRYEIPAEYPVAPQRWKPPFLMMRWPSSTNGLYEFQVELWRKVGITWTDLTATLPPAGNSLVLRIDNSPPTVDLQEIRLHGTTTVIAPCDIVEPPVPNAYDFKLTAWDPNQHLLSYRLWVLWGKDKSETVLSDHYNAHVVVAPPHPWGGVFNQVLVPGAGGWSACCNCAHTFYLRAWKRTINGYDYILRRDSHQSVTLNNVAGPGCCDRVSCPGAGCP